MSIVGFDLGALPVNATFVVKKRGKKHRPGFKRTQAILNLRKEEKFINGTAQTQGIMETTIRNVLNKKETTGVLGKRHQMGRTRKTTTTADESSEGKST